MPHQNRVTPFGSLIATSARGTLMGNRGCLHDEQGRIKRLYGSKRWIICRLNFKNRRRAVMTPGRYTELFFLDEATALAAGHRPCAECMHQRYQLFVAFWMAANPGLANGPKLTAAQLDVLVHRERIGPDGQKITYSAPLDQLPAGAFVRLGPDRPPLLVFEDKLLGWLPEGYGEAMLRPAGAQVQVLTPYSIVRTLAHGYPVEFHPSIKKDGRGISDWGLTIS